jgi:multidrug transporter EmrE-like cation transporter
MILKLVPVAMASLMAFIDTVVLSGLKKYSTGDMNYGIAVPLGMLIYSLQPLIFLQSLKFESMTVMNMMWDVMSDIYVTLIGLFYFKERISRIKMIGLSFAFVAVFLLSFDCIYPE